MRRSINLLGPSMAYKGEELTSKAYFEHPEETVGFQGLTDLAHQVWLCILPSLLDCKMKFENKDNMGPFSALPTLGN